MRTQVLPARKKGRYRITGRILGSGGMGQVVEGFDTRLMRRVAVKILASNLASDRGVRARFEREARAAACLEHPNIVTVFDIIEVDGSPAIVMELLEGRTLADRIKEGPVPAGEALGIALEVAAALDHAHSRGVVHRDVKPGNVLLCRDGRAKLVDLGIAKSVGDDLTRTNELLGSPAYVAPELLRGMPASASSDIYALGVTLYECLSGTRPFKADTPWSVLTAIQQQRYPRLQDLVPDVPAEVRGLVQDAMAPQPEERIHDARSFVSRIEAIAGSFTEPVEGAPELPQRTMILDRSEQPADETVWLGRSYETVRLLPGEAFWRRVAQGRIWVAAAVLAVLLAIVGIAAAMGDRDGASPPPRDERAPGAIDDPIEDALVRLEDSVAP